jgi:A/G-specific adenine glycosylase
MSGFSRALVHWQRLHGRHGLPWQHTTDPYRVWLSEVMLQQTQVATVLGYYERFVTRFADVQALARAPLDEVFALWSGLGYYSRARNLHRCAQQVCTEHGGRFPEEAERLAQLPGIGPSTAAAIAAFCFGQRVSILDGNVQRVLARLHALHDDLRATATQRTLRALAADLLPGRREDMASYTQGLMDLGATLCLPRNPQCPRCPVQPQCAAHARHLTTQLPVRSKKIKRSAQSWWLLLHQRSDQAVWLVQRPARGIWSGLWTPPVFAEEALLQAQRPSGGTPCVQHLAAFKHVLTHKDLYLHPVLCQTEEAPMPPSPEAGPAGWFTPDQWPTLGLPTPVRQLLDGLHTLRP